MMKKTISIFGVLVLAVLNLNAQTETLDEWIKAYKSKKESAVQKLCTESYVNSGTEAKDMFKFYTDSNFDLTVIDDEVQEDRAYLWISEDSAGHSKGQIFFYLLKEKKDWLIDGINRHKTYPDLFIAGKVTGHFDASKLSTSPEFDALGKEILSARLNQEKQQDILYKSLAGFSSPEIFDRIDKTEGLSFHSTYHSEQSGRLILCYSYSFKEKEYFMTFYLRESGDKRWELYEFDYRLPHNESFFKQ